LPGLQRCGLGNFHSSPARRLRKRETELQRELREAREENAALRRVLQGRT